ncbi:hypothetical protein T4E_268 [Trichinella pseudospiralis]|uniref:Uncharacterized protein n=1 Tax=Trichinella pseudospiralis TaxID=6337 RepID=A0A0V0XCY4_TRIPS|nr:hypothetical protein T4E_268 [Trichinella pseudospiralis]
MDGANKAISSAKASAVICCPNTLTAVFSASFGKTGKTDLSSSSRNKANKIPLHGSPWHTPTDQRAVTWVPMHLSLQGNQPVFLRQELANGLFPLQGHPIFHRATPLEPGEDQCTVISSPQQTDVDLVRSRRRIRCLLHLFPDL